MKKKSKFENNWLFKSLENLENIFCDKTSEDEGYLINTCKNLRKKPLNDFSIEDLRIMIGQDIGLKYLIPLALEVLNKNILAEGDLYDGDLLKSVLLSNKEYWKTEVNNWNKMCEIFNKNKSEIEKEAQKYDTGRKIIKAFNKFEKIN